MRRKVAAARTEKLGTHAGQLLYPRYLPAAARVMTGVTAYLCYKHISML